MQTETRGGEASVGALFFILCLVNSTSQHPQFHYSFTPFCVGGARGLVGRVPAFENSITSIPITNPPTLSGSSLGHSLLLSTALPTVSLFVMISAGGRASLLEPEATPSPSVITARSLVFGAFFATVNSSANSKSLCHV